MWRPQVTSQYKEPDCIPDPLGDLEILHKEYGKPLWVNKAPLPPRTDIIQFNPEQHGAELQRNLQWKDCPENMKEELTEIIKDFWDVFIEEGVRNNIRGVQFHVDTGETTPICVRPPRYGPHETRVINDLVAKLEANGIVEDDDGPWGAPIVLAAKPNQEHLHWSQYTWRLCVSYRKINAVTRPFTFPIIRCDDAVKEIGNATCFITMDLDSGYWQVPCEEKSKAKLAFFTPTGKKRFRTMPMGATNAHPVFVALVAKFKKEWDILASGKGLRNFYSQIIVDDIIIAAKDTRVLIEYFKCILSILLHYRCTAKLKKCRFRPSVAEFVGLDIHPQGNSPAKSKFEAFQKLGPPKTFTDLNMLIGCFGFYQEHLPLYEVRIKRWRETQKLRPPPGTPKKDERTIIESAWDKEDDLLLDDLKKSILSEPILKRPDSSLRFYLKTDWSKMAMGAALLQPATSDSALQAMNEEIGGEQCKFDLTKSGPRLHPVAFISRRTSDPEKSYHSYVGEACAGIWAIEKFRPYLFGREFTWLTDCSGLKKFFEGEDIPTHMLQRWRMQLLRYDFTIVHRPGRMMFECDLLSRYNQDTQAWREEINPRNKVLQAAIAPIPFSNHRIKITGTKRKSLAHFSKQQKKLKPVQEENIPEVREEEEILRICDTARSVWIVGARMNVVSEALNSLGVDVINETPIDDDATWRHRLEGISWEQAQELAANLEEAPNWLIVPSSAAEEEHLQILRETLEVLVWKGLSMAVLCHNAITAPSSKRVSADWHRWIRETLAERHWTMIPLLINNNEIGGAMEVEYRVYVLCSQKLADTIRSNTPSQVNKMERIKEKSRTINEVLTNLSERKTLHTRDARWVTGPRNSSEHRARIVARVTFEDAKLWPVYSTEHVCPDVALKEVWGPNEKVLMSITDETGTQSISEMTWQDNARLIGVTEERINRCDREEWNEMEIQEELRHQATKESLQDIFALILTAEEKLKSRQRESLEPRTYLSEPLADLEEITKVTNKTPVFQTTIDRWTTIPLPTHRQWAEAIQADRDLKLVLLTLEEERHLERHRLSNKKYHEAWEKGQLEQEDGLLYHTGEPRITQIRQLRRRVVPKSLRQVVITAYHATPLAGHSGIYRTYWRIAARYWWPRMYLDIKEAVGACAHCKLANAVGQESKSILEAISCDTPFDVIAVDVWSPGAVPDSEGNTKALTSLDTMTGFASTAILQATTSDCVARACFATFFVPNGLPKLVLIDAGSENKGELVSMCETLRIKYHMVAPEDHNGILCERFHRYLNKVQKIGAADSQTYTQWAQGVMFATYSWNAAPIDGTNLIRSFVAKGRVFPFPLQIAEEDNPPRIPPGQGEEAIAFVETNFPLWARQSTMLQILIAERRERHRDLANRGRTVRQFNVGDLVIVRKQVQSSTEKGIPAKQKFKWKGIYRVVEKLGEKSYNVQKLPTVQGKGKLGKIRKYSAGVMEKIPSSLIVNKHLDTSDTRLATLEQDLVTNPLEQSLGMFEYGKYVQAAPGSNFAYDRVEDLWSIDIESEDEEDTEDIRKNSPTPEYDKLTLYKNLQESKDKMVIIRSREKQSEQYKWYLAQVDWDETNELEAKNDGVYRLKWLVPHHCDSAKRRRRDCRFWPEIHEVDRQGNLGRMRFMNPTKTTREFVSKQGWAFYEWDVNLLEDLLVGPFDLQVIGNEPNRVGAHVWSALKVQGRKKETKIDDIDRVVPLS